MDMGIGQIEEMTLDESQDLLRKAGYGRLGLAFESEPYVVPVWHVYDGEHIWFHVGKHGKKTTYLQANPEICFQVDEWVDSGWASVICLGTVAMTDDLAAKHQFIKLLQGRDMTDEELNEMQVYVCTMTIAEITGRKSSGYAGLHVPSVG
jgi:nitroimidazol reductase NimA-like FMN-containing flavoprotein (pyridoxamine 5'-phosphate oxidase superfamily)